MVASETSLAGYIPKLALGSGGEIVVQHKKRLLARARQFQWAPKASTIPGAGLGLFSLQDIKFFGTNRCLSNSTQLILPLTGTLTGVRDTGQNVAAFFCEDKHDLMGLAGPWAETHPYRFVRVTLSGSCAYVNSVGPMGQPLKENHLEIDKCGWFRIVSDICEGEEVLTEYRELLHAQVSGNPDRGVLGGGWVRGLLHVPQM